MSSGGDPEAAKARSLPHGHHKLEESTHSSSPGELCRTQSKLFRGQPWPPLLPGQVTLGKYFLACPVLFAGFYRRPMGLTRVTMIVKHP